MWKSRISRFTPADEELLCQPIPDSFEFALEDHLAAAKEVLQDERVALLRYRLVPLQLEEAAFWRAFFYRLSLPADDDEGVYVAAVHAHAPPDDSEPQSQSQSQSQPELPRPPPESPPTTSIPMPPLVETYFSTPRPAGVPVSHGTGGGD